MQEHVQWDPGNLPVQEPSEYVGERRYSQDHERIFKFQVQARNTRVQISMDVRDIQTAHKNLRLRFEVMFVLN